MSTNISITIPNKYTNFFNIFSSKFATLLLKYTKINNNVIEWIDNLQQFQNLINSPKLIKLEMLKTYIKTNSVKVFITSSKFSLTKNNFFL